MQATAPAAVPTRLAVWIVIVAPFTKYALILTPIATALEELLPGGAGGKGSPRTAGAPGSWGTALQAVGVRTALVASTLAVAVSVPFFAYVMARPRCGAVWCVADWQVGGQTMGCRQHVCACMHGLRLRTAIWSRSVSLTSADRLAICSEDASVCVS